jgi:HK97 family phage portal protein
MAVIQSFGQLTDVTLGWQPVSSYGQISLYDQHWSDYASLYRTQPNVRTCVDFLARNIAQLGLHVYRRVSDTDRKREREHPLARLLEQPLPPAMKLTRYRMIERIVGDLGVYYNAFLLKMPRDGGGMSLLPVPPMIVTVKGALYPQSYEIQLNGRVLRPSPDEIVHIRGYAPDSLHSGISPLETLRRVLAEEAAMGDYREHFWTNSARMQGIIERPADAPEWSQTARERFMAEFAALYTGTEQSGKTAILEEGMQWKEASFSAQESEYLAGRKLTREECARAYHIPLPMVGILDNATFSNIKEQHKNLYQDSLGPWLAMIEQDLELQLLADFTDSDKLYIEFNIQEKLQGSFEEQVLSLQSAVGRPWMTANEARARQNLPSLPGGDDLVTPLNVLTGGQASPRDSAPPESEPPKALSFVRTKSRGEFDPTLPDAREQHRRKWQQVLAAYFERQEKAIASRVPKGGAPTIEQVWTDAERWDRELAQDLYKLNVATATYWARWMAEQLEIEIIDEQMYDWLSVHARRTAANINATTREQVTGALNQADFGGSVRDVFANARVARVPEIALTEVTTSASFGATEAAKKSPYTTKTWQVNSGSPRATHAAMDGETVAINERFSNGLMWPGDPTGGSVDERAGCQCSVGFGRG